MKTSGNERNRIWDDVYQSVIRYYLDTNEELCDYKGGVVNESYISDYFLVSATRFRIVCDLVTSYLPKGSSILEVGPGYGFILLYLKKVGYSVTGAELEENIQAYSRAMKGDIPVIPYNIERDQPREGDTQFDLVIASEVLEHLHINLSASVKKLTLLCKKDGFILVTVPNIYRLENYLKIARGINICEEFPDISSTSNDPLIDYRTHPREPTMKDVMHAFQANNLQVLKNGYFSSSLPVKHPLFSSVLPSPMREHISVIARKKSGDP